MVSPGPAGAALLLALVLAGCAGAPPLSEAERDPRWQARAAQLARITHWTALGRIGVTREAEAWSGNLDWRQTGERYSVDIVGPFGQGQLHIEGDAREALLRSGDGRERVTDDVDALVEAATGVPVPVRALRDWVLGRPLPGVPAQLVADAAGRLARLEQAGWTVEYSAYEEGVALPLPTRLRVTRDATQVRLAIEHWTR